LAEKSIAVIGAGVIGAASALALRRDGHNVILLEREAPAAGASYGNAGAIVNGSCAPTAMPGVWREALRALTDPLAPVAVRPSYLPRALPWLARFLLDSRTSRVNSIAAALHALTREATADWRTLTEGSPLAAFLHEGGWLKVYESHDVFDATARARELLDAHGSPYELLTADDIQDLEPHLAPVFVAGILQKDSLWISSPAGLVRSMVDAFTSAGGEYRRFDVRTINPSGDRVRVEGPGAAVECDGAVIAAGVWSRSLARQLGDDLPLDTERGYHMMFPAGTNTLLGRSVLHGDRSFVLTPMADGMRMTSQVEIAGVDAQPDYRRIRSLAAEAKRMLPSLDIEERSVWMGCRPSLPDSLPVIGPSTASERVIYAFGHQHLGMTMGATTARLVADLVAGRQTGTDLAPYGAKRY
jgi:D-amino-acid dehydrogenase